MNVYEHDDKISIVAEIPGLDKKNVSVDVEDSILTISGDKHGLEDNGGKCITRELKQSSFKRSFNLGEHLEGDDVSAKFKDGMLSISIPKIEPEKPKKTLVKINMQLICIRLVKNVSLSRISPVRIVSYFTVNIYINSPKVT